MVSAEVTEKRALDWKQLWELDHVSIRFTSAWSKVKRKVSIISGTKGVHLTVIWLQTRCKVSKNAYMPYWKSVLLEDTCLPGCQWKVTNSVAKSRACCRGKGSACPVRKGSVAVSKP